MTMRTQAAATSTTTAASLPAAFPTPALPARTVRRHRLAGFFSWLAGLFTAAGEFIVGDSGIESGDPCLNCSPSTESVRAFIANRAGHEGWRIKVEHGGGLLGGAIALAVEADPNSIVIHPAGEECPRQSVAECDVCQTTVIVSPYFRCPNDDTRGADNHRITNVRPKPPSLRLSSVARASRAIAHQEMTG